MRIVITGRQGQVARALAELCAGNEKYELVHAARPEIDLENTESLAESIAALYPDVVINAAAYTAVDRAESEPELAMIVNAVAAGAVALGAQYAGAPVIQISTDYVFDGALDRPYREEDPVSPLGVYGHSKLAGEQSVEKANPRHIILRTSWVYSPFGHNFVKTMLHLAKTKDTIGVVSDQIGSPTSAFAIGDALLCVIDALSSHPSKCVFGVFHFAAEGTASWSDFAQAIFETAGSKLPKKPRVIPISTAEYPTAARRPANSRLDTMQFKKKFGYNPPDWRVSLAETISRLI